MKLKLKAYGRWLQILGVGVFLLSLQMLRALAASSAQLYIKPVSQTLNNGQTVSAAIRLKIDQTYYVGYVKAYITFPADKLKVTNVNSTNSDFNKTVEESYDNNAGVIKIQRSGGKYHTGDYLVVRVTFQAKSPGTAKVNFSSSQASYYSYSANELTGVAGATYTIPGAVAPPPSTTPPPSPPPTTQAPNPPPSSSTSSTSPTSIGSSSSFSAPVPLPSSSQPNSSEITSSSGVSESNVSYNAGYDYADLMWYAPTPSTALINYGLDPDQLNNIQNIDQKHTDFATTIGSLIPGRLYYFSITTKDDSGQTLSFHAELTTKGYPVEITLLSPSKKPVKGVELSVANRSGKSSADGKVTLNLPSGSQQLSAAVGKTRKNFTLDVKDVAIPTDRSDPELQRFTFTVPGGSKFTTMQKLSIGVISVLLVIFSAGLLLVLRGRSKRPKLPPEFLEAEPDIMPDYTAQKAYELEAKPSNVVPRSQKVHHASTPKVAPAAPHPHSVARTVKPPSSTKADKSSDEPKDMFDIAEERFNQDERLKDFR